MKIAITLALLGLALASYVTAGPSDPEPRPDDWWMERHIQYKSYSIANPLTPIVFYGDSITEGWGYDGRESFEQFYQPLGVANYGISGDKCENVLWRIVNDEMIGLSPKLVVVKIGTNSLENADNLAIAGGITTIASTIRQKYPTTKILLLGILPRNGMENFERIVTVNRYISALHDGQIIFFLDMFGSFIESWGTVNSSFFYDGLHLWDTGYRKWAEVMNPLLYKLIE